MISLADLAAHLAVAAVEVRPKLEVALEVEMLAVAEYVRERIIGYEHPSWAPLAARTIERKTRLGYVGRRSATDPLYRTGELMESIEGGAIGLTGLVVSDSRVAVEQELGTATIPPRPFLALGMVEMAPIVAEHLSMVVEATLIPRS